MPNYSEIFSNTFGIILVVLFFGGSIFVHEFGHFLAAKWRGLVITRFSIGFGPKIVSWKGKDGCEYRISLLPLGGYVALPQLADMGKLEGGNTPEENQLKNLKPIGCADKIIVSAAGAVFNIFLAFFLACLIWGIGLPSSSSAESTVIGDVFEEIRDAKDNPVPSPAKIAGLQPGDKVLEVDGSKVSNFMDIMEKIALGSGRDADGKPSVTLKIKRGDRIFEKKVGAVLVSTNVETQDALRMIGISPMMTMLVGKVMPNSPASLAGLKANDILEFANHKQLFSVATLSEILNNIPKNGKVELGILRDGKRETLVASPDRIATTKPLLKIYCSDDRELTVVTSFAEGTLRDDMSSIATAGTLKVFSIKGLIDAAPGDILYSVNGEKVSSISVLNAVIVRANENENNAPIKLSFAKPDYSLYDVFLNKPIRTEIDPSKMKNVLGCIFTERKIITYPNAFEQFSNAIENTVGAIESLINPQSDIGINSLAGPVDIGRVIYKLSMSSVAIVISFAVLLNINLAILNLLPLPVLDGGHIAFAVLAKVRGKQLKPETLAAIQGVFSILLISFMVYIVYYGFMRWSGDSQMEAARINESELYISSFEFKNHE